MLTSEVVQDAVAGIMADAVLICYWTPHPPLRTPLLRCEMIAFRMIRSCFLWSALMFVAVSLPAQQGGQQGGGGGKGGTGGASGGTQGSGSQPGTGNTTSRTSQPNQTQPSQPSNSGRQQQQMPFISGVVVMEDGSPLPMGVAIERICNGNKTKESHVSSDGHFSFQVGANTGMMTMDASDTGWGSFGMPGGSGMQTPGTYSPFGIASSSALNGCELKADLPGYHSSSIILNSSQLIGRIVDVGTIVLHPISKVQGTTVSATNLQAPKDAKKAMERGEKALRKEKLDEAEASLKNAVDIYPAYAAAWFTLGRIYEQQQRIPDARLAFSRARDADGNFVLPYVELARLAAVERKWQEAADLTDRALALNPLDIPDGFFLNSLAHYNLKNFDAAERSARKTQRLDSQHRFTLGHLILANILKQKQDFAGEAEQLRYYLKYAPQSASADQVRDRLQELDRIVAPVPAKERAQQ